VDSWITLPNGSLRQSVSEFREYTTEFLRDIVPRCHSGKTEADPDRSTVNRQAFDFKLPGRVSCQPDPTPSLRLAIRVLADLSSDSPRLAALKFIGEPRAEFFVCFYT
jgi:hypothetical protein